MAGRGILESIEKDRKIIIKTGLLYAFKQKERTATHYIIRSRNFRLAYHCFVDYIPSVNYPRFLPAIKIADQI